MIVFDPWNTPGLCGGFTVRRRRRDSDENGWLCRSLCQMLVYSVSFPSSFFNVTLSSCLQKLLMSDIFGLKDSQKNIISGSVLCPATQSREDEMNDLILTLSNWNHCHKLHITVYFNAGLIPDLFWPEVCDPHLTPAFLQSSVYMKHDLQIRIKCKTHDFWRVVEFLLLEISGSHSSHIILNIECAQSSALSCKKFVIQIKKICMTFIYLKHIFISYCILSQYTAPWKKSLHVLIHGQIMRQLVHGHRKLRNTFNQLVLIEKRNITSLSSFCISNFDLWQ